MNHLKIAGENSLDLRSYKQTIKITHTLCPIFAQKWTKGRLSIRNIWLGSTFRLPGVWIGPAMKLSLQFWQKKSQRRRTSLHRPSRRRRSTCLRWSKSWWRLKMLSSAKARKFWRVCRIRSSRPWGNFSTWLTQKMRGKSNLKVWVIIYLWENCLIKSAFSFDIFIENTSSVLWLMAVLQNTIPQPLNLRVKT